MRNFTSLPKDDRQRYQELARLELDTQLELDKRYSDKVKEIRYKELLGIEEIPELDTQEKERQQKDFNFQIQTLFQNLIPFFSNQENIRRYIEQYVKNVDKAFFINSNIEAIKKKLEGTTNLEPSIFEAFISDLYREEEGLTGIETRDYQKRFKILEDKIKALNIYKTDPDIGERLSLIKKEYNKDSLSNMKREKLLTALRTLFEMYKEQDEITTEMDELTNLMGEQDIRDEPFSDIFEEMETKRLQQMDDDELEEKFNEFVDNFKNSPFFGEKDVKRQFNFEFLIKKFETIPKDKKVEYLDRIQEYLQQEIEA